MPSPDDLAPPRLLFDDRDQLGEGPVFDDRTGELLWVDIAPGTLHRWSPATGERSAQQFPTEVGAVILTDRADTVVVALAHELRATGPDGDVTLARLDTDDPSIRFNDCRSDPLGRIYAGTMAKDRTPRGNLYRFVAGGTLEPVAEQVTISNGVGWDPSGERMYYIDTPTHRIDVFDYDLGEGRPSDRRVWVELDPSHGSPDGLTVDDEGGVWVALFGGGCVRRYGPDGELDVEVLLPVTNPTCPAFGGPGLATLYVTTARHKLSEEQLQAEPQAGALLALEPGHRGMPAGRFLL